MTPLPTIANVFRVAFDWVGPQSPPVNVFHVLSPSSSDVTQIATAINAAHQAAGPNMWKFLSSTYTCNSITITPLDGHTAGQILPQPHVQQGQANGDILFSIAAVVSFHTAQRGARGRGRVYVGPTTEQRLSGTSWDGGDLLDTTSAWAGFHAALRSGTPALEPVVASYVHADAHPITSVRTDAFPGTQRRRLARLAP